MNNKVTSSYFVTLTVTAGDISKLETILTDSGLIVSDLVTVERIKQEPAVGKAAIVSKTLSITKNIDIKSSNALLHVPEVVIPIGTKATITSIEPESIVITIDTPIKTTAIDYFNKRLVEEHITLDNLVVPKDSLEVL